MSFVDNGGLITVGASDLENVRSFANTLVFQILMKGISRCLLDMGIYPLAIANYFVNKPMRNLIVKAGFAPNSAEDDLIILADSGDIKLNLSTSFQCKLPSVAVVIGNKGHIVISDFWRANSCELYHSDELIDTYQDNRESLGFNYEAYAAQEALQANKLEHENMPHKLSQLLQEQMEEIRQTY